VDGCNRSFTKKGNLTVHIRTFHEGEKRFACGETDLSASNKVTGWDGYGCGKRYGTKLALEEHIRTSHMGFKNSKAERRERLGLTNKPSNSHQISTLAALTGQGYVEETGRHIACFYESCEHRFHRDYDLWVHMAAKHGCSEDQVQALFMQRALLSDQSGPGGNALGIYGLEFDQSFASTTNMSLPTESQTTLDPEMLMQPDFSMKIEGDMDSMIPGHNEMASMDPAQTYYLMEE
jgi:general transcription factor IIIA